MNAPKGGSSHYTFRKVGCQPITIPKHEPIKKVYVEMVKQIVESEADSLEEYSGQFKLRIPRSLHRSLAEHSKRRHQHESVLCISSFQK